MLSAEFGDELFRFSGHSYSGRSGTSTGGIEHVDFDGRFVVAHPYEGTPERAELPVKLELADSGNALILTWANGRRETRERREAIATTKYGEPCSLMELVHKPVDA